MKNKYLLTLEKVKHCFSNLLSNKIRLIKALVILLIITAAIFVRFEKNKHNNVMVEIETSGNAITQEMYVDISGEVNNPGVYIVDSDTRLFEVISKAGGLTDNADTNQINQADYVEDGEKIVIPSKMNLLDEENNESTNIYSSYNSGLININTASKEQLMMISGVGDVTADKIIEYRSKKRFKKIEEIMNIKGIGNAKFEKMKDEITT